LANIQELAGHVFFFFSPMALLIPEAVKKSLLEKAKRKRRKKAVSGLDPGQ